MKANISINVEKSVEVETDNKLAPNKCWLVFDNTATVMIDRNFARELHNQLTDVINEWDK